MSTHLLRSRKFWLTLATLTAITAVTWIAIDQLGKKKLRETITQLTAEGYAQPWTDPSPSKPKSPKLTALLEKIATGQGPELNETEELESLKPLTETQEQDFSLLLQADDLIVLPKSHDLEGLFSSAKTLELVSQNLAFYGRAKLLFEQPQLGFEATHSLLALETQIAQQASYQNLLGLTVRASLLARTQALSELALRQENWTEDQWLSLKEQLDQINTASTAKELLLGELAFGMHALRDESLIAELNESKSLFEKCLPPGIEDRQTADILINYKETAESIDTSATRLDGQLPPFVSYDALFHQGGSSEPDLQLISNPLFLYEGLLDQNKVSIALGIHRARNGKFPTELSKLAPDEINSTTLEHLLLHNQYQLTPEGLPVLTSKDDYPPNFRPLDLSSTK